MIDIAMAKKKMNWASATYEAADELFRQIADRILERLPFIRLQPHRILECGARTGYLLHRLQQYYPQAQCIGGDLSFGLLAHGLQQRKRGFVPIAMHYDSLPFSDASFDFVVSAAVLHTANDLSCCLREFFRVLKPNGLFFVALLGVDTLKELRESFSFCAKPYLYTFPDLHEIGDILLQNQFENPVMEMERMVVRYQEINTLFQDFKATGMSNVHQSRPRGLFGKQCWRRAISHYQTLCEQGCYPATFEIVYGHAWKPEFAQQRSSHEYFLPSEIPIL